MSKMTTDIETWLLSFDCGKKWYNTIASDRTKEICSKDLKQYCDAVGKTPTELLDLKIEGLRHSARSPKLQGVIDIDEAMPYQRDKAILWFVESTPLRHGSFDHLYWRDLKSTSELLKKIIEESHGQPKRTPEEDANFVKLVPYYIAR